MFPCSQCQRVFGNGGALGKHISTHVSKRTADDSLQVLAPRQKWPRAADARFDGTDGPSNIRSPGDAPDETAEASSDFEGVDPYNANEGDGGWEHDGPHEAAGAGESQTAAGSEGDAANQRDETTPSLDTTAGMFNRTSYETRRRARSGPPTQSFRAALLQRMDANEVVLHEWTLQHNISESALADLQRLLTQTNSSNLCPLHDFTLLSLSPKKRKQIYDQVLVEERGHLLAQHADMVLSNGRLIPVQGHDSLANAVDIVFDPQLLPHIDFVLAPPIGQETVLNRDPASGSDAQYHRKNRPVDSWTVLVAITFDGTEVCGGSETPVYLSCCSLSADVQNTFASKRIIGALPELPPKTDDMSKKVYDTLRRELRQRYLLLLLGPLIAQQRTGSVRCTTYRMSSPVRCCACHLHIRRHPYETSTGIKVGCLSNLRNASRCACCEVVCQSIRLLGS